VERYLPEDIATRAATAPRPARDRSGAPGAAPAAAQPQDDHYENLLSRQDFLRQSSRLKARVADRRRELSKG
jgi:hypothetical protein